MFNGTIDTLNYNHYFKKRKIININFLFLLKI